MINMSKFIILLLVLLNYYGEQLLAKTLRGARAKTGQFPWLIQFATIAPCGGILVSPDWVLTAAQCVQYKRNSISLYAAGLNGTGSRQTLGVKATYIFPQYKAYSTIRDHEHNIALLKLVQPFDMCDDKVQLLDVAPVRLDDDYRTCLIFGWQSYIAPSTKVLAKPIQYSYVLLNSWKLCTYMLKGNISYNNVFCAMIESEDGMKACAGNPGSPVVCEDQYHRMILLGIASWSNFSLDCGAIPTYLGVSVFRSWMYDLIFNDRKIQESHYDSKSTLKNICGYDRYLGSIVSATNTWNYSDLLGSEHRQVIVNQKQSVDTELKPLVLGRTGKETIGTSRVAGIPSKFERRHETNDYSDISSIDGIPFDIIEKLDDNLKQYQEVGRTQGRSDRINDIAISIPASEVKSSYLGQSIMNKNNNNNNVRKTEKIDFEDELYDLDENYFMGQSNSLHIWSKERYFFSILLLGTILIML